MVEPNPSTTMWPSQWRASNSGCQPCQTAYAVMSQALELARLALVILQAKMAEESRMRETGNRHPTQHGHGPQPQQGQQGAGAATGETPASSGPETMKPSRWRVAAGVLKEALGWVGPIGKAAPVLMWAYRLVAAGWLGWVGKGLMRWLGLW